MSLLQVLPPAQRENHKTIWFYTTVSIPKLDEHFGSTLTSFRTVFFCGGGARKNAERKWNMLNALWWSKMMHRKGRNGKTQMKVRNWKKTNRFKPCFMIVWNRKTHSIFSLQKLFWIYMDWSNGALSCSCWNIFSAFDVSEPVYVMEHWLNNQNVWWTSKSHLLPCNESGTDYKQHIENVT